MKPSAIHYSARKLLLSLVTEAAEPLASQTLVKMGELFGITANNVRVSLNRLVNEGLLQLSDPGVYVLRIQAPYNHLFTSQKKSPQDAGFF